MCALPLHLFDHHPRSSGGCGVYIKGVAHLTSCETNQNIAYLVCWTFPRCTYEQKRPNMPSAHLQAGGGFFVATDGVARLVGCNTFENEATDVCL